MNIVVNTRLLLTNKLDGIGWFTYETLLRVTRLHPEHHFTFLFDRKYSEEFIFSKNITPVVIAPQARHPFLWYSWFEWSVPRALKKYKADLFLSQDGYLSLSTDVRSMTVIHDLNFEHFPKDLPWLVRKYYKFYFPEFAKKAARIATVSQYSKNDIVNIYHIDPDKIDVVYNGANENFKPISNDEKQLCRKKYTHSAPFFLFIGALHPRKNLANLFIAFDSFKKIISNDSGKPPNHIEEAKTKLLIVGKKKWWTKEMQFAYQAMQFKNEVIFIDRLSGIELNNVMASALALTYVSNFEGFGIPVLEAMYCETPVITSDVTSMPEIGGDAVLLVDPASTDSITNAMVKVAKDQKLREKLINKGKIQRQKFSWDKTAELLWQCIEKVMA